MSVEHLRYRYPAAARDTFRDVSFDVPPGGSCALMGPSGCGKTTLLMLLGGFLAPTGGLIRLGGRVMKPSDATSHARKGDIAWLIQSAAVLPQRTVLDNITLPAVISGQSHQDAAEAAISLAGRLGLEEALHRPASKISGGQAQRIAVARALLRRPSLVLADEPTANLDRDSAEEVIRLLVDNTRPVSTLVVATHDELVAAQCDNILRLRDLA